MSIYAFRPESGYLAIAGTEGEDGQLYRIPGETKVALADVTFWTRLTQTGIYAAMVAENSERMARIDAHGVSILTREKAMITNEGLTCAELSTTDAVWVPEVSV